jgi:chorismate lyase
MTMMTSQHPNARLSSPRNARNSQSSFVSSKRRRPSIVSSRKTTTRVKSFRDDDDIESYQTVANPLQYTATEREAMDRKNSLLWQKLSPAWRVLLLSDGSVTRHLSVLGGKGFLSDDDDDDKDATSSLLSESNVKVEVTSMKPCARDKSQPEDVVKIKGPLVQREVYLRYDDDGEGGGGGKKNKNPPPLVYACSWWNANALEKFMKKREETMWSNLRKENVELYREVRRVYLGKNRRLAKAFGCEDLDEEIWARHYIFWSGGEPVTVVFEAFSPKIEL